MLTLDGTYDQETQPGKSELFTHFASAQIYAWWPYEVKIYATTIEVHTKSVKLEPRTVKFDQKEINA